MTGDVGAISINGAFVTLCIGRVDASRGRVTGGGVAVSLQGTGDEGARTRGASSRDTSRASGTGIAIVTRRTVVVG